MAEAGADVRGTLDLAAGAAHCGGRGAGGSVVRLARFVP